MRPGVVVVLSFVLTVSLLVTVAPPAPAEAVDARASAASADSVLRVGFLQKVDSLNPYVGLTDASRFFYSLVYDSLFSYDGDLEPVGNLAVGWQVVSETDPELVASGEPYGSVWEYEITENAVWHDGTPLTAADIEWVIDVNAQFNDVFWSSQPYSYFIHSAEAVGDYLLRIHFYDRLTAEPMPVSYGDAINIPIIPEHLLSTLTPFDLAFSWTGVIEDSDPPVVGTGPFMVGPDIHDEWLAGDRLTLYANPDHHWAADRGEQVQFDRLEMRFFSDATAMSLALEVGEIDVAKLPPKHYVSLRADVLSEEVDDIEVFDGPSCTQSWSSLAINMNLAGPNLADRLSARNVEKLGELAACLHAHAGTFVPPDGFSIPTADTVFPFREPVVLFAPEHEALFPAARERGASNASSFWRFLAPA